MEIILLEKIHNLGSIGDKVTVRGGYGRYLIPIGKAVPATKENILKFEKKRAELEKLSVESLTIAKKRAEAINLLKITIYSKAGDEGKLFGSIGAKDIANAITTAGEKVAKSEIRLATGSIRQTGEHEINLHLHPDVNIPLKINIVAED
jgi:large subunit ribosomal protein L9